MQTVIIKTSAYKHLTQGQTHRSTCVVWNTEMSHSTVKTNILIFFFFMSVYRPMLT